MPHDQGIKKPERRHELDFLRGLALIVMTVGHPLRVDTQTVHVDFLRFYFNIYGELFSAMFMFMSAVNVQNFLASAARQPRLNATRFYLLSSVALFLMGGTYNICVGTLPVIDIIQSIAIGTLVVYLLLRLRVPTWGFVLLTAAFLAAGPLITGFGPMTEETMRRVGSFRYLLAMFGPIPWLGFFTYGIVVDRLPRGRLQVALGFFFLAVFAAAHFLPHLQGTKPAILLFKANSRYIVMCLGLLPALHLFGRAWYRGRSKVGKLLESWGVESLVFLVFHWAFIYLLRPLNLILTHQFNQTTGVWTTGILALTLMGITLPRIVKKRDEWTRRPNFSAKAWRVFFGSLAGWIIMLQIAQAAARGGAPIVWLAKAASLLFAFFAAFSFCFLYPYLRARIREPISWPRGPRGGRLMAQNPTQQTPKRERRPELDLLRGIALIVMTVGHPLRADVGVAGVVVDFPRLMYNHYGELFSGLFMFISGINVVNFLASAERNPNFDATRFYIKSSLLLFAMGWTYNLCVGTSLFINIIQCVALGTLVTYLLLKWRIPTWGLLLFTVVVFVIGLVAVGPGPVTEATMRKIHSYRYFVSFFGPFPWLGYFTFGVVVDRVKSKRAQNFLMIACTLIFLASHALPELRGTSPAIHLLKANLRHIVMTIGMLPAMFLASKRYYKGISRIGRTIEFWGRESLVFLVFHWFYIFMIGFPGILISAAIGAGPTAWFIGFATLAVMAATVRPIAGLRDRWTASPRFGGRAWLVFIAAMCGWAAMLKQLLKFAKDKGVAITALDAVTASWTPEYRAFFLKTVCAFIAAMTFCFLYPYLRVKLRVRSTHGPA